MYFKKESRNVSNHTVQLFITQICRTRVYAIFLTYPNRPEQLFLFVALEGNNKEYMFLILLKMHVTGRGQWNSMGRRYTSRCLSPSMMCKYSSVPISWKAGWGFSMYQKKAFLSPPSLPFSAWQLVMHEILRCAEKPQGKCFHFSLSPLPQTPRGKECVTSYANYTQKQKEHV